MTLMRWDGVIHWSPKRMEILQVYMTLGQVKVWARTDLALVSKAITVTCILDCVWPVCLRTGVIDVTHHCDVCLGDDIPNGSLGDTMGVFVSCWRSLYTISEGMAVLLEVFRLISCLRIYLNLSVYGCLIGLPIRVSKE